MIKEIFLGDRLISYEFQKKKVKNINIRVKSDLSVRVSAPHSVSQKEIDRILKEKTDFILSAIEKYEARRQPYATEQNELKAATVFGRNLPITVIEGKKNNAVIGENGITVTLKDTNDKTALKKAVDLSLDSLLRNTVEELCRKAYPKFEKHLPSFPTIKYRRMKSRWGSCNYKKYILTFNYHLVRAPLDCVEYVVYHEFTHFIHPDHQKGFYLELSRHVPDCKEKKKKLQAVNINQ